MWSMDTGGTLREGSRGMLRRTDDGRCCDAGYDASRPVLRGGTRPETAAPGLTSGCCITRLRGSQDRKRGSARTGPTALERQPSVGAGIGKLQSLRGRFDSGRAVRRFEVRCRIQSRPVSKLTQAGVRRREWRWRGRLLSQLGVRFIAVVVLQELYFGPVWETLGTEARQPPAGAVAGRSPYRTAEGTFGPWRR